MALTTVDREPGRLRNSSPGLRLILLCTIAVTLMVLDHREDYLSGARLGIAVMLRPLEILVSSPFELSRSLSETFANRNELLVDNQRLLDEALIRSAALLRMAALEAENARLRALLDSTAKVGDDMLIAEIVSVDMNPFRNVILINKGGRDGVTVGQALIDADGVVGQILRDRHHSAEAMLVTDLDHALPVELARNRLRSIAVGTGELDRLSLPFLPRNADVEEGDLLITSGLGGKFPPGYPVAVVRHIRSTAGETFLEIDAEPLAALNRIREVLVIKREPGLSGDDADADLFNPASPAMANPEPPVADEVAPEPPAAGAVAAPPDSPAVEVSP